jgi:hypothetical protein
MLAAHRAETHTAPAVAVRRSTPTCVGKTIIGLSVDLFNEVHPHVCGENRRPLCPAAALRRSTPTCDAGKPHLRR